VEADLLFVRLIRPTPRNFFEQQPKFYGFFAQRGTRLNMFYPMPDSCGSRLDSRRRRDHNSQDSYYMFNEMLPVVSRVIQ